MRVTVSYRVTLRFEPYGYHGPRRRRAREAGLHGRSEETGAVDDVGHDAARPAHKG